MLDNIELSCMVSLNVRNEKNEILRFLNKVNGTMQIRKNHNYKSPQLFAADFELIS